MKKIERILNSKAIIGMVAIYIIYSFKTGGILAYWMTSTWLIWRGGW